MTRVDDQTFQTANSARTGMLSLLGSIPGLPAGIEIEPFLYRDTYQTEFTLSQPIWLGGSLRAGHAAAAATVDRARAEDRETRASVIFRTKAAFYRLRERQELLEVARSAVAAASERRDEMAARHEVGEIDLSFKLRWDLYLSEQELALAAALGDLSTARAQLNILLGREAAAPLTILPVQPGEDSAGRLESLSWPEYLELVRAGNPRQRAAQAGWRETTAAVAAARAGWLPSVLAEGAYGWKADDDLALDEYETWRASLVVSLPLFDGLRNVKRHQQASALARAAGYAARAQQQAVEMEAIRLYNQFLTARQQVATARLAREQAKTHLEIVLDRFRLGLVGNVDQIDAQAARDRAEAGVVSAEVAVAIALAALEQLIGPTPGE